MSESRQLPEPCQTQLETYREIQELDGAPLLAVHLHKAKFEQRKALEEYRSGEPVSGFLPSEVYDRSEKMVKAKERTPNGSRWKTRGKRWPKVRPGLALYRCRCTGTNRASISEGSLT